jgi:hypothetical protein
LVPVPPPVVTETFLVLVLAELPIVTLAVIWVALFTVKPFTVIPDPKLTVVAPVKLIPVMVTLKVCPRTPLLGLTELMVGAGGLFTVKARFLVVVPPRVVTETFLVPVLVELPIVMLTVIWVTPSTVKLFTVIPEPKVTDVAPVKLVPVMLTLKVCPRTPLLGLTVLIVGAGGLFTVKPRFLVVVPPGVVTKTFLVPVLAELAIVMLAVIWVALSTVKPFTVIPEPKLTDVAPVKLVPVMVTLRPYPL